MLAHSTVRAKAAAAPARVVAAAEAAAAATDSSTSLFGCFPEICQMLRGPSSAPGERNLRERFVEIS